jgi:acetate kinase
VVLDVAANAAVAPDADVAADGSAVRVLVVAAREDLQIATSVRQVLHATGESPEPNA